MFDKAQQCFVWDCLVNSSCAAARRGCNGVPRPHPRPRQKLMKDTIETRLKGGIKQASNRTAMKGAKASSGLAVVVGSSVCVCVRGMPLSSPPSAGSSGRCAHTQATAPAGRASLRRRPPAPPTRPSPGHLSLPPAGPGNAGHFLCCPASSASAGLQTHTRRQPQIKASDVKTRRFTQKTLNLSQHNVAHTITEFPNTICVRDREKHKYLVLRKRREKPPCCSPSPHLT